MKIRACFVAFLLFLSMIMLLPNQSGLVNANPYEDETPTLLVGWDFENITDDTIPDISGNDRTGTILKADLTFAGSDPSPGWIAARWFNGKAEDCIVYDTARNSNVFYTKSIYELMYDDMTFYNDLDDFTFSAWVKFADVPPPNTNVFTRSAWLFAADRKATLGSFNGVGFDFGFAGQQTFYTAPGQLYGTIHTSDYPLVKSKWINFAFVMKNGNLSIYVDGESVDLVPAGGTSDYASKSLNAGATPARHPGGFDVLTLGGCHQTGTQFGGFFRPAHMFLDNACFYSKALTQEEIMTVMSGNLTLQDVQNDNNRDDRKAGCASVTALFPGDNGLGIILVVLAAMLMLLFPEVKEEKIYLSVAKDKYTVQ
jgi:hypothetical protein